jgi:glutamyl-tRNA reductase
VFYVWHRGDAALVHLFRAAAGLESLVSGESQVLGQVRDASKGATACAAAGPILHVIFQRALRAGKRARQQTGLGRYDLSVPSVAVALARQVCDSISQ